MNSMDLLEAIGDINGTYILEAREPIRKRRVSPKLKVLLIAAAMALLLAGCAIAVLKLQNLKIGQWIPNPIYMNEAERDHPQPPRDVISLMGYAGTPEYLAAQEWLEFENGYDRDGELVKEADRIRYQTPEAYDSVFCYTQEMQDKVDEICEKYDLKLPGRRLFYEDTFGAAQSVLFPALGIPGIHRADAQIDGVTDCNGSYFANGAFDYCSDLTLTDPDVDFPYNFFYAYQYFPKGYFITGYKTVADMDAFDQWEYMTKSGVTVLLAISPDESLVLADRDDAFISICVHYPSIGEIVFGDRPMTRKALEAFADAFDFTIKPIGVGAVYESYADFLTNLYPEPTLEDLYLLRDLDGDGSDEALTGRDGFFDRVLSMVDGQAKVVYASPGCKLCADNVILDYSNRDSYVYRMVKLRDGQPEYVDYLEFDPLKAAWGRSLSLGDKPFLEEVLPEEEIWTIVNRYYQIMPQWTPIFAFPGYEGPGADPGCAPSSLYAEERARQQAICHVDPYAYIGAHIYLDGRTYVYQSPYGIADYELADTPGWLSYPKSQDLSTDFEALDGEHVTYITGGLVGDALTVDLKEGGSLLFVPEDVSYDAEWEYKENEDGTLTILKYRGNSSFVVVPWQIGGRQVTVISGPGEGAFSNCPSVEEVSISNGVKRINDNTFYSCCRLRSVHLPESLESIGHSAFQMCPILGTVIFEGNAPAHGNYLFDTPTAVTGSFYTKILYNPASTGWDGEAWSWYENKGPY